MASRPYFDRTKGAWFLKWKAADGWTKARLCPHPLWSKGDPVPKRPPSEAVQQARKWEDLEAAVRRGVDVPSSRPMPLAAFLEDYLTHAAAGQVPGSMRLLRRVVRVFGEWCKARGVEAVPGVTAELCRSYLAERAGQVAHATIKTERAALSPAWSRAFQDGKVTANPWLRAPVPGKPREDRPKYWTPSEIDRLAAACKPWLGDVVIVGAYTGLRITSLLGLTWADVDLAAGTIRVRAGESKSGRAYEATMLGPAREVLTRRKARAEGSPLVFPGIQRGKRMHRDLVYKRIARTAARAGIPLHGRWCHCLRHSFATMCINKGIPLAIVSRWLGHSSIATTQIYFHNDTSESRRWSRAFDEGGGP
jgi:integrase